ncbi:hypothetical protein IE81DRAFT_349096 [Ceraceosorus guamensis]|uniref:Uncharacterized protein n=1 Tax=Ceraceosorus guamensis TaxID=1522189 RepID=A0A316VTT7_9BASI|nr:hypothetical protein IE81DRAFT_349096 [Ceraceosorus guamensis]PWN40614.1 hypothetical protein IE81DRAFT_349096 [Ceraceosorus guamensis]
MTVGMSGEARDDGRLLDLLDLTIPPLDASERISWYQDDQALVSLQSVQRWLHRFEKQTDSSQPGPSHRPSQLGIMERGSVILAMARYLGPRPAGAEGWDTQACRNVAREVLRCKSLAMSPGVGNATDERAETGLSSLESFTTLVCPRDVVLVLLQELPQLLPSPRGITPAGRAANITSNAPVVGSDDFYEEPRITINNHANHRVRGLALGVGGIVWIMAHAVIAACTSGSGAMAQSPRGHATAPPDDYSATFAPSLLPALLALIGAPQPASRLSGLHVLHELLQSLPAVVAHLQRSGLLSLVQEHLDNSMTYLSEPLGAALLFKAVEVMAMLPGCPESQDWAAEAAFERIQRAWAYAPTSLSDPDNAGGAGPELPPGMPMDGKEQADVLCATMEALHLLLVPDNAARRQHLEVGSIAKSLGSSLEFLSVQLCFEPSFAGADAGCASLKTSHRTRTQLARATFAARAIRQIYARTSQSGSDGAVAEASGRPIPSPPGLAVWSPRVLTSAARCWVCLSELGWDRKQSIANGVALHESGAEVQQVCELREALAALVTQLRASEPEWSSRCVQRLLAIAPECANLFA